MLRNVDSKRDQRRFDKSGRMPADMRVWPIPPVRAPVISILHARESFENHTPLSKRRSATASYRAFEVKLILFLVMRRLQPITEESQHGRLCTGDQMRKLVQT
jgi:hypothetical protein